MNEGGVWVFECECGEQIRTREKVSTCKTCHRELDVTAWGTDPVVIQ